MNRYQHALGRAKPSDIKLSSDDLNSMIKPSKTVIYDNLYAKPSQAGVYGNERWSVVVLFSVNGVIYYGQYDFQECRWRTLPGDDKSREFIDREVEYWFHHPETIEMFKKYRDDVKSGANGDYLSRIDEYEPKKEVE